MTTYEDQIKKEYLNELKRGDKLLEFWKCKINGDKITKEGSTPFYFASKSFSNKEIWDYASDWKKDLSLGCKLIIDREGTININEGISLPAVIIQKDMRAVIDNFGIVWKANKRGLIKYDKKYFDKQAGFLKRKYEREIIKCNEGIKESKHSIKLIKKAKHNRFTVHHLNFLMGDIKSYMKNLKFYNQELRRIGNLKFQSLK